MSQRPSRDIMSHIIKPEKWAKSNEFTRVLGLHPRHSAPTNTLLHQSTDAAAWLDYTNSD